MRDWWQAGRQTVGTWCSMPTPAAVEATAQAGFDWVIVDWQHGHFGEDSLGMMILVASHAGAVPLVRVPVNEPWPIQRALDLGAHGIVVPLVNSAADAGRAAAAMRYPPAGVRSVGPIRASRAIGADLAQANREVVCIVQIETVEALAAVDAIAGTDGVDALFVGPADMATSLGLALGAPELEDHLGPIPVAAARHGVALGRHVNTVAEARTLFAAGYGFLAISGDTELLAAAAVQTALEARIEPGPARPEPHDLGGRLLVTSDPDR